MKSRLWRSAALAAAPRQQTEYVIGGGAENYIFLALAADRLYGGGNGDAAR